MTLTYLGEITSLVYTSEEIAPLGEADLGSILESSRRYNEANEITGLLVGMRYRLCVDASSITLRPQHWVCSAGPL
jgi:hypothetical protein